MRQPIIARDYAYAHLFNAAILLIKVRGDNNKVLMVGIYFGPQTPKNVNDYLKKFVDELNELIANGLVINENFYNVRLQCFVCDTPAKSFVLNIQGHCGFHACPCCEIITFYQSEKEPTLPLRSIKKFQERKDTDHHQASESTRNLDIRNFDIILNCLFDYQHLVCLEVVKPILQYWNSGLASKGSSTEFRIATNYI